MNADALRSKLIELAAKRLEVYYHWESNTHIVQQRKKTVFDGLAIKGCGELADVAFQDFQTKLSEAVSELSFETVQIEIKKLTAIQPTCQGM